MPLLFGDFFNLFLEFLLFCSSGFMILLVLVQRGRGGGLTGALGGMGGQSAFGAKAGDVFTRITVFSAIIWIFLCLITIMRYTYVEVDTTAMKEYEYQKLLTVDGAENIGKDEKIENTSVNEDDVDEGGSSMKSTDTEDDKKNADDEESEKKKEEEANKANATKDSGLKGDESKKDDSASSDGNSSEKKNDDGKSEAKSTEPNKSENNSNESNDKSKEDKSGEPKTESKDGNDKK